MASARPFSIFILLNNVIARKIGFSSSCGQFKASSHTGRYQAKNKPHARDEAALLQAVGGDILAEMRFEKIWVQQYKATKGIKRRFGVGSALDYLVGEKLVMFAMEADRRPEFAKELPKFLAAVWQMFNQYELAGYIAMKKPTERRQLRGLLFVK